MSSAGPHPAQHRPRIDLVVMLAGGLRPSALAAAASRSVLDLSVDGRQSVLEHWLDHLATVVGLRAAAHGGGGGGSGGGGGGALPVRILHGSALAPSPPRVVPPGLDLTIERETKEFRGPAGVVKDAAEHLPEGASVLVIEAARWFAGNLGEVVDAHHDPGDHAPAAVTVVAGARRAPAGIVVLERSTLDLISQLGFMDLKEQWLGRVAETGRRVRVVDLGSPTSPDAQWAASIPLRDREGLLTAARHAAAFEAGRCANPALRSLYAESGPGYFAALSPEATIQPNSSIVDSVIMAGAVVHEGAIVARSIICPGAMVEAREVVVDQVRPAATGPHPAPARAESGQRGARPGPRGTEFSQAAAGQPAARPTAGGDDSR